MLLCPNVSFSDVLQDRPDWLKRSSEFQMQEVTLHMQPIIAEVILLEGLGTRLAEQLGSMFPQCTGANNIVQIIFHLTFWILLLHVLISQRLIFQAAFHL